MASGLAFLQLKKQEQRSTRQRQRSQGAAPDTLIVYKKNEIL
jgi:hypothetical protein